MSNFIPYQHQFFSEEEMVARSHAFYEEMDSRRTLREFSDRPVPKEVIENIILADSTAPSGAHKQPWTFCVVSGAEIKKAIKNSRRRKTKRYKIVYSSIKNKKKPFSIT
jgi:nitroreductase